MKAPVQRIYPNINYAKAIAWCKLIFITGSSQLLIQGLALISGILVIRLLPAQEYALYTLANTMLGTMTILADGGISTGVLSQGSKVWQDRKKLGAVVVTGLHLRRKFAIASILIAMPLLIYLLWHHGAGWLMCLLVALSLIFSFYAALSGTLLQIPFKLQQDIAPLQKNQVALNAGRLLISVLTLFIFPWAFIAILAAGIPQIWTNLQLKRISKNYTDWNQKPDSDAEKKIMGIVKRILPGSVYYCFAGQITIWLISIFGSTIALAQAGALSRLSMMLTVFSGMFATLISPRFARLADNRNLLLGKYIQIQIGLVALSFCIITIAFLFPSEVLWVLGANYAELQTEFILCIAGSCLALIAGISFTLCTSKGWVINPIISIAIEITAIVFGVLVIDISSLKGLFIFNIFIASVQVLMYVFYCLKKIMRLPVDNTIA